MPRSVTTIAAMGLACLLLLTVVLLQGLKEAGRQAAPRHGPDLEARFGRYFAAPARYLPRDAEGPFVAQICFLPRAEPHELLPGLARYLLALAPGEPPPQSVRIRWRYQGDPGWESFDYERPRPRADAPAAPQPK